MKKLFAIAILASFTTLAAPLQWTCDWPEAKSQTFSLYQGETATFEPTFRVNGRTVTNATIEAVWYQTNGMGNAWWKLDGATFAPSNDVGAASYRFFVEAKTNGDTIYRANGALRMLPSPGFTPNAIEPPIVALDFSTIEVANAPYYDKAETEAKIVELAPAPGDYANVSNKAMTALQEHQSLANYYNKTETEAKIVELAPAPGDYANVSNKAMTALQEHQDISGKLDKSGDTMTGLLKSSAPLGEAWDGFGVNGTIGYYGGIHWGVRIGTGANSDYPVIIGKQGNEIVVPSSSGTMALTSDIPSVGDYATVSNRAMSALQSFTETDPNVPEWAKAETKPTYTASEVGATTAADVYRLVAGTNVVLIVTNYNSATHAAAMKLQHLDPESGQYVTYWDELRQHGITYTNGMNYTDAAIAERAAPRAWSGTTSGLGSEAPAGVTWISTPETVIAGGYEYEKVITSAGAVWVLSSNGLTTGATTNSFFRISASDGTELFSIEKTDSYLIGVSADAITRSGNTVTIPVNIVAGAHPYIRATTNLVNAVWVKEDENGFSCPWATVSWSGTTGAYIATVTCSQPQAFFYFEYTVEGVAKIKNSAKTEMSGGIIFNGTTYMPTVNGNKLEFVAQ